MPTPDVGERAADSELNKNSAALVSAHGHARFEDNIRPSLGRCRRLVRWIPWLVEEITKPRLVIRRHEDEDRLSPSEGSVKHLADVWIGPAGGKNRLVPLDRLKAERPKKGEHGVTSLPVPPVYDEH